MKWESSERRWEGGRSQLVQNRGWMEGEEEEKKRLLLTSNRHEGCSAKSIIVIHIFTWRTSRAYEIWTTNSRLRWMRHSEVSCPGRLAEPPCRAAVMRFLHYSVASAESAGPEQTFALSAFETVFELVPTATKRCESPELWIISYTLNSRVWRDMSILRFIWSVKKKSAMLWRLSEQKIRTLR